MKLTLFRRNSFKDLAEDVTDTIRQYFISGMTPGTAYKEFVLNLRLSSRYMFKFHRALADRSVCPRRRDFNMLYGEFNLEKYGRSNCETMFVILEDRIINVKEKYPGTTIKCTPLPIWKNLI